MDKPDLLAEFKKQLEAYERYQSFIDKARSMTDKFRPEVVEKVVTDNTAKMREVAEVLSPLVPEVQAVVSELHGRRGGIEEAMEAARLGLEELELRKMIGELDDEGFDAQAAALKSAVDEHGGQLAEVDAELASFSGLLSSWASLGGASAEVEAEDDLLEDLEDEPPPAVVEPSVVEEEPEAEEPLFEEDAEDEGAERDEGLGSSTTFLVEDDAEEAFGDVGGRGSSVQVIVSPGVQDDVSAVFDDSADSGAFMSGGASGGVRIAGDVLDDLGDASEDDSGAAAAVEEEPAAEEASEGQAVLIVGEGTDEEHVYPFTGEVISLGRGRDNTIQVKNDSKVSRYHCKLFKRDASFFIEDNKSANGTLVDGELITEKRLLGGEEVIIGETFFRFRINP
ncbi:MAG: FHA domain-containing protein [Alphaproteobacteria bacterium]|nr:FHA domain-containing protein [Alphaproteobacteria bacterium]